MGEFACGPGDSCKYNARGVEMDTKGSISGFSGGFLLGVAMGLAVAFLFASQPGVRSRKILKEKLAGVPESMQELTADREKVYRETLKKRKGQPLVNDSYFKM